MSSSSSSQATTTTTPIITTFCHRLITLLALWGQGALEDENEILRISDEIQQHVASSSSSSSPTTLQHVQVLRRYLKELLSEDSVEGDVDQIIEKINEAMTGLLNHHKDVKIFVECHDGQVRKVYIRSDWGLQELRRGLAEYLNDKSDNNYDLTIRDSQTGVFYLLEDMRDIYSGCVIRGGSSSTTTTNNNDIKSQVDRLLSALSKSPKSPLPPTPLTTKTTPLIKTSSQKTAPIHTAGPPAMLRKLRDQLQDMRLQHDQFTRLFQSQVSTLSQKCHHLVSQPRVIMNTKKQVIQQTLKTLPQQFIAIKNHVDELKQDLVRRGCQPSREEVTSLTTSLQSVSNSIRQLKSHVIDSRADWKRLWEAELQTMVQEQELIGRVTGSDLIEFEREYEQLQDIVDTVTQVIELKAQSGPAPPSLPNIVPVEEMESTGSRQDLIQEIKLVVPDSDKRIDALHKMEKRRKQHHQHVMAKMNPLLNEIREFLDKSGEFGQGILLVDAQRRQKDETILKEILLN